MLFPAAKMTFFPAGNMIRTTVQLFRTGGKVIFGSGMVFPAIRMVFPAIQMVIFATGKVFPATGTVFRVGCFSFRSAGEDFPRLLLRFPGFRLAGTTSAACRGFVLTCRMFRLVRTEIFYFRGSTSHLRGDTILPSVRQDRHPRGKALRATEGEAIRRAACRD